MLGKCTLWYTKMVRVAVLHHGGPDPVPGQPVMGLWRNRGTGTYFSASTSASLYGLYYDAWDGQGAR